MPVQIIPRDVSGMSRLMSGLGTGLGSGLQALAQQKLQQLGERQKQRTMSQQLQQIPGITPEMADAIPLLPPKIQQNIFSQLGKQAYLQQQQAYLDQQQTGQVPPEAADPGISPQQGAAGIAALQGAGPQTSLQPVAPQQVPRKDAALFAPLPDERIALKKQMIDQTERKMAADEIDKRWQQHDKMMKKIDEESETALKNMARYGKMKVLSQSGELSNPVWMTMLKAAHVDYPILMTPKSEEYRKTVNEFVTDIKKTFGARITEKMIEVFMKTLPTLQNTHEGRMLILSSLESFARAKTAKQQAMNEITDESGGAPPRNLSRQLGVRMKGIMNTLAEELKGNMKQGISLSKATTSLEKKFAGKKFTSEKAPRGIPFLDEAGNKWIRDPNTNELVPYKG